jgi:hypothetical protein
MVGPDGDGEETLLEIFAAWAGGRTAKMKEGSGWRDITPDNLRVRAPDGSYASIRDAIAAYDRAMEEE